MTASAQEGEGDEDDGGGAANTERYDEDESFLTNASLFQFKGHVTKVDEIDINYFYGDAGLLIIFSCHFEAKII